MEGHFIRVGNTNRDKRVLLSGLVPPTGIKELALLSFCPGWCLQPGQKAPVPPLARLTVGLGTKGTYYPRTKDNQDKWLWNKYRPPRHRRLHLLPDGPVALAAVSSWMLPLPLRTNHSIRRQEAAQVILGVGGGAIGVGHPLHRSGLHHPWGEARDSIGKLIDKCTRSYS